MPLGRSACLIRTSTISAPYWRATRLRALWILSIIWPRSGLSRAANGRRPSSLRSAEARIGRSWLLTFSSLRAEMYICSGSTIR